MNAGILSEFHGLSDVTKVTFEGTSNSQQRTKSTAFSTNTGGGAGMYRFSLIFDRNSRCSAQVRDLLADRGLPGVAASRQT